MRAYAHCPAISHDFASEQPGMHASRRKMLPNAPRNTFPALPSGNNTVSRARILNRNCHAEKRDMPAIRQFRSAESENRLSYACKMLSRKLFAGLTIYFNLKLKKHPCGKLFVIRHSHEVFILSESGELCGNLQPGRCF